MLAVLIYASYYDFYFWSIHLYTLIIIGCLSLINLLLGDGSLLYISFPLIIWFLSYIISKFLRSNNLIASADLVVLTLLVTWLDNTYYIVFFVAILGIVGTIICIITDKDELPLIPPIAIAWAVTILLQNYIL